MKIDRAREIQEAYIEDGAYEGTDEFMEALQLGIEALKRISVFHEDDELLLGETTE